MLCLGQLRKATKEVELEQNLNKAKTTTTAETSTKTEAGVRARARATKNQTLKQKKKPELVCKPDSMPEPTTEWTQNPKPELKTEKQVDTLRLALRCFGWILS